MVNKRILFGASYSVIEPLGLLHLAGLARDLGWERKFHLVKDHDFEQFFDVVKDFKPDAVGFNVYTGNHLQLHEAFKRLKKDHPNVMTITGGPHATYFPSETLNFADYVVMSEGFGALRKILKGEAAPGILPLQKTETFPHPDRETFYKDSPRHRDSTIKSIITMTGCPFKCTYCYNSSTPKDIAGNLPKDIAEQLAKSLGMSGRLFPHNVRTVEDVIREGKEIGEKWSTKVIYFQDDVHGFDTTKWMPEFAKKWPQEVSLPYHAQMRWEMTRDSRRLDYLCQGGCFGLTLAIEAADPEVRAEVLDRRMPNNLMFDGMKDIVQRGLRVRTEQISGLPYGATTKETAMNLDADLELVKLNVNLKEKTGGPTMAWASTLAPYKGTKLGTYCEELGFYRGDNSDVPDTFFDRSVLRFMKTWVGPEVGKLKNQINTLSKVCGATVPEGLIVEYNYLCGRIRGDDTLWLSHNELETYRNQNAELRRNFNFFTLVPQGHVLAESYLKSYEPFSYERLGREAEAHLRKLALTKDQATLGTLTVLEEIRRKIVGIQVEESERDLMRDISSLLPYFACLPKGELALQRTINYSKTRKNGTNGTGLNPTILSTAVRHHLYDEVLYETNGQSKSIHLGESSRYPSKV